MRSNATRGKSVNCIVTLVFREQKHCAMDGLIAVLIDQGKGVHAIPDHADGQSCPVGRHCCDLSCLPLDQSDRVVLDGEATIDCIGTSVLPAPMTKVILPR